MSGIKDPNLAAFHRKLRARGMTVSRLAAESRVGRANLEQMMNGQRNGRNTWKHVMPHLEEAEVFHLKQCSAWNIHAEDAWNAEVASRGLAAMAS